MATKRTHTNSKNKPSFDKESSVKVAISRKTAWRVLASTTVIGPGIIVMCLFSFSSQVNELRKFKGNQESISNLLREECYNDVGWSVVSGIDEKFNKESCFDSISKAESLGVIGQICEDKLTLKYRAKPDDVLPVKNENCSDIRSRIAEKEQYDTNMRNEKIAQDEIFNTCNSRIRMRSANCAAVKAKYNNKWTYVNCDVYGYVVPSSQIYDGAWHYSTFGGYDPHKDETCYW